METNIYKDFASILTDFEYLLKNNELEVVRFNLEKNPSEYQFKWNPLLYKSNKVSISNTIKPNNLDRNFSCKLCAKKIGAIRNFTHKGSKRILVLHYTSEFRKGQPLVTKSNPNLTLRTREAEELFDRLIKKVFGFSSTEIYFQEYPACTFNQNSSSPEDWLERMNFCDSHVKNTILSNKIIGVILMGAAAVLRLGVNGAKEKAGIVQNFTFDGIEIPVMVIRSPEGVFSLEEKRKKLEKNKSSDAYKLAKKEEDEVKLSLVNHLTLFKNQIGDI